MNAVKLIESFTTQIGDYAKRVAILESQLAEALDANKQLQEQLAAATAQAQEPEE